MTSNTKLKQQAALHCCWSDIELSAGLQNQRKCCPVRSEGLRLWTSPYLDRKRFEQLVHLSLTVRKGIQFNAHLVQEAQVQVRKAQSYNHLLLKESMSDLYTPEGIRKCTVAYL